MPFNIVFPVFPGVTQLDFTGPAQMFAYVPDAKICVAAASPEPIQTDSGFQIVATYTFDDCPPANLICIPGGPGVFDALLDPDMLAFVDRQCDAADYITSVCTGMFILGALGRLHGKRATSHWGYTSAIPASGAIFEDRRVVVDGNVMTAGGITSGIDYGLTAIDEIWGEDMAKTVQLRMEYDPAPPFDSGHPRRAEEHIRNSVEEFYEVAGNRMAKAMETAARSNSMT